MFQNLLSHYPLVRECDRSTVSCAHQQAPTTRTNSTAVLTSAPRVFLFCQCPMQQAACRAMPCDAECTDRGRTCSSCGAVWNARAPARHAGCPVLLSFIFTLPGAECSACTRACSGEEKKYNRIGKRLHEREIRTSILRKIEELAE